MAPRRNRKCGRTNVRAPDRVARHRAADGARQCGPCRRGSRRRCSRVDADVPLPGRGGRALPADPAGFRADADRRPGRRDHDGVLDSATDDGPNPDRSPERPRLRREERASEWLPYSDQPVLRVAARRLHAGPTTSVGRARRRKGAAPSRRPMARARRAFHVGGTGGSPVVRRPFGRRRLVGSRSRGRRSVVPPRERHHRRGATGTAAEGMALSGNRNLCRYVGMRGGGIRCLLRRTSASGPQSREREDVAGPRRRRPGVGRV